MILIEKKQKGGVGTNSFTYDPETDTYNSRYSLNEIKIKGDKKKYNPIGQNVARARDRFAMKYMYPPVAGAVGLRGAFYGFGNMMNIYPSLGGAAMLLGTPLGAILADKFSRSTLAKEKAADKKKGYHTNIWGKNIPIDSAYYNRENFGDGELGALKVVENYINPPSRRRSINRKKVKVR